MSEKLRSNLDVKTEHKSDNEAKSAKTKAAPDIVVTISDDSKSSVQSEESKTDFNKQVNLPTHILNWRFELTKVQ